MSRVAPLTDLHRRMAQTCVQRAQQSDDPTVRAWWVSAAQKWYDRAVDEEKAPEPSAGLVA